MHRQLVTLLILIVILLPSVAWAQIEFKSLVAIPGIPEHTEVGLAGYVAAFFYIAIGVAALLAVVKLVIAGARYMLSDVTNTKEAAKADIRGAVIGLLVILTTYIILNTINTQILDVEVALPVVEFKQVEWSGETTLERQARLRAEALANREACSDLGGVWSSGAGGAMGAGRCGTATVDGIVRIERTLEDPEGYEAELQSILDSGGYVSATGLLTYTVDNLEDGRAQAVESCRGRGGGLVVEVLQPDGRLLAPFCFLNPPA